MPHIVVVGSLNMDLVVEVPKIPAPGETILGRNFATFPGGKGANQAVAAARLGAQVSLIGRVGDDDFGRQLLNNAQHEGIDVSHVGVDGSEATGVAMITVDGEGQNSIAVASGANFRLTAAHVRQAWSQLSAVDLLIMPLETPLETIETAVTLAQASGVRVILNPAPARELPASILSRVFLLVPNEPETAQLTGLPVESEEDARTAARHLLSMGVQNVILTLGSRGALLLEGDSAGYASIAPFPVEVVDTTADGDAFMAGLAVALGEGGSLTAAAQFASAAGALTVTRSGAQPSLPGRDDVDALLGQKSSSV